MTAHARVAQLVELHVANVVVGGSSPVSRSQKKEAEIFSLFFLVNFNYLLVPFDFILFSFLFFFRHVIFYYERNLRSILDFFI